MTGAYGGTSDEGERYTTLSADYVFRDTGRKSAAGAATLEDGVQDTTAENLFRELKAESEAGDPLDDFEELSAESIVSNADGHEHEQFTDGGQTIAAGSEVENLLIPDRSEGEEFRWVDPESSEDGHGADAANETSVGDAADATDLFETPGDDNAVRGSTETDAALDVIGGGRASESRKGADAEGSIATSDGESADDADAGTDDGGSGGILARVLSFLRLR